MQWSEIPELDEIADRLVGLVAQVRDGFMVEAEDVLLAAWSLGRCRDRSEPKHETCVQLLREVVEAPWFADRVEWYAYKLSDRAGHYTGPAGFYSLTSVLDERSGIEFISHFTGHRFDTDDLDDRLVHAYGDAIDFPDALPEGVPDTHWWWTLQGTWAERVRRETISS